MQTPTRLGFARHPRRIDGDLSESQLQAQCFAGDTCYYGLGDTAVNKAAAFAAYESASNNGSPYAMCCLAKMILKEEGKKKDGESNPGFNKILAKKWYNKAIDEHSYPQAQYEMGCLLMEPGKDYDVEEAMELMRLAARQGHTNSLVVLGRHDMSQGRHEDAVTKFRIASDNGSADAFNELGMCFYENKAGNLISEVR